MTNAVIVLDLETTGLDTERAAITEVAAMYMHTDIDPLYFVPHHDSFPVQQAGEGLQVSRYFERGVWRNMLTASETRDYYIDLWNMLNGNTVAGSNPRFDTNLLSRVFRLMNLKPEPWHHRLLDLSNYAAATLDLEFTALPGLAMVCELASVDFNEAHSAMGDVKVTRECFKRLREIRAGLRDKKDRK